MTRTEFAHGWGVNVPVDAACELCATPAHAGVAAAVAVGEMRL